MSSCRQLTCQATNLTFKSAGRLPYARNLSRCAVRAQSCELWWCSWKKLDLQCWFNPVTSCSGCCSLASYFVKYKDNSGASWPSCLNMDCKATFVHYKHVKSLLFNNCILLSCMCFTAYGRLVFCTLNIVQSLASEWIMSRFTQTFSGCGVNWSFGVSLCFQFIVL